MAGQSDVEVNKALVRDFVMRVQNGGEIEAAGEYIDDACTDHTGPPDLPPGIEGAKLIFRMIRAGFPDHDAVIHHQVAEGDMVATYKSFTGTHQGEFLGVPPTGRRATIRVMDFVRVRDGKIVDHWNVLDIAGLMQQLGVQAGG
jgi:predicted ester cyclase